MVRSDYEQPGQSPRIGGKQPDLIMGGARSGSVACAGAPTVGLLIAGRVVQAIGAAFVMPTALGLLLARCPVKVRTQAVSLFGGLSALAAPWALPRRAPH